MEGEGKGVQRVQPPAMDDEETDGCGPLVCCFPPWRRTSYSPATAAAAGSRPPQCVCLGLSAFSSAAASSCQPPSSVEMEVEVEDPSLSSDPPSVFTQVDYTNHFIPNMTEIMNCPFYWGKINRYEAEALLVDKPEGSFLLRDSAQDEFVFSVSFRRYNRSLHARIEENRNLFSFDCHDPGVHSSRSIRGLLKYYQEPLSCMFFEPMLLHPVNRRNCFSLQFLARAAVCDVCTFSGVSSLPLPKTLKEYLREYSYRHKIRTRRVNVNLPRPPDLVPNFYD